MSRYSAASVRTTPIFNSDHNNVPRGGPCKGSMSVGKRAIVQRELSQPLRNKVVGVELKISWTMCEASIDENPKKLVEDKV